MFSIFFDILVPRTPRSQVPGVHENYEVCVDFGNSGSEVSEAVLSPNYVSG